MRVTVEDCRMKSPRSSNCVGLLFGQVQEACTGCNDRRIAFGSAQLVSCEGGVARKRLELPRSRMLTASMIG